MTADPYKMKRFNYEDNFNEHNNYSSLPVSLSNQSLNNNTNYINKLNNISPTKKLENNPDLINNNNLNKQTFVQAHYEANKELANQLKANCILLHKGAK